MFGAVDDCGRNIEGAIHLLAPPFGTFPEGSGDAFGRAFGHRDVSDYGDPGLDSVVHGLRQAGFFEGSTKRFPITASASRTMSRTTSSAGLISWMRPTP